MSPAKRLGHANMIKLEPHESLDSWVIGIMQGLYTDYFGYILGLYRENGKENGNYYNGLRV